MVLFVFGAKGVLYLIKPVEKNEVRVVTSGRLSNRQVNLWSAFFISIVAVYGITVFVQAGFLPVGIIVGSMMGGLMGWRKTTARFAADPYKLTPLYLLPLTLFYVHVGEEVLTNFSLSISSITGIPWKDKILIISSLFSAPLFGFLQLIAFGKVALRVILFYGF